MFRQCRAETVAHVPHAAPVDRLFPRPGAAKTYNRFAVHAPTPDSAVGVPRIVSAPSTRLIAPRAVAPPQLKAVNIPSPAGVINPDHGGEIVAGPRVLRQ